MKRFFSTITVILSLMASVPAFSEPGPIPPDPELRELQEEALSLALIHELALTTDQRSSIRDILTSFRGELGESRSRLLAWQNDTMKPYLRLVIADLKQGKEPSPVSPETVAAHRELQQLRRDMEIQAEAVMKRVINLLAPEQVNKLNRFHLRDVLGLDPPPRFLSGPDQQDALAIMDEIRNASEEDFQRLLDRLGARVDVERPGAPPRRGGPFAEERREIRGERIQRLIDLMTKVRAMTAEEYAQRVETLKTELEQLLPRRFAGKGPNGPGMRGAGPGGKGPGRGPRDHMSQQRIIFSDAFYNAL